MVSHINSMEVTNMNKRMFLVLLLCLLTNTISVYNTNNINDTIAASVTVHNNESKNDKDVYQIISTRIGNTVICTDYKKLDDEQILISDDTIQLLIPHEYAFQLSGPAYYVKSSYYDETHNLYFLKFYESGMYQVQISNYGTVYMFYIDSRESVLPFLH